MQIHCCKMFILTLHIPTFIPTRHAEMPHISDNSVTILDEGGLLYLRTPFEVGILHHGSVEQLLVKESVDLGGNQSLQHDV